MTDHGFLDGAVVLLAAAIVGVFASKRLGLGAVIGYLAAGLAIGPWGLRFFTDPEQILHFAELGVVLLLFVIGLELQPVRLWSMRRSVFGLGAAQVGLTGATLAALAWLAGLAPVPAIIVGLTLALSSTAFALQVLAEKNQLATAHGRAGFATLLFQDLAVIPLLAVIPVLSEGGVKAGAALEIDGAWLLEAAKVVGVLVGVVAVGRVALRYGFRLASDTRVREIFAAAALLTVVGTALLLEAAGLSMALGAFIAGVLLADSEYRHAVEADIEPFKGLLLGLFFIAVGMSVNVGLLQARPGEVVAIVAVLVAIKAAVLYGLGRWHGLKPGGARIFAITLSQGGEFAFVLLTAALAEGVVRRETAELLTLAVIASMLTTPLLYMLGDRLTGRPATPAGEPETPPEGNQVIIAGFGRFGQIVGRVLRAKGIGFTALESEPLQVDSAGRFGTKVYFGDASRLDLLRAAGAEHAVALVVAVDEQGLATRAVRAARQNFPHLKIYARARNRRHAYMLMDAGADHVLRETFLSSIEITRQLLIGLGLGEREARRLTETFRRHDEARLYEAHAHHTDEERMIYLARKSEEELAELFREDAESDPLDDHRR